MMQAGVRSILLSGLMVLVILPIGCGGGGGGGSAFVPPGGGGDGPPRNTGSLSGRVLPSGSGLTVPASSGGQTELQVRRQEIVPGEAVVWFADGVEPEEALARLREATGRDLCIEALLAATGPALLSGGPAGQGETMVWIEGLGRQFVVKLAEPNSIQHASAVPGSVKPNDPITSQHSWSFDLIRTSGAWEHTKGSSSVVVAVVDTGVGLNGSMHPDLHGQVLAGWDFVDDDADATDISGDCFHGTHVAGTIAARVNNGQGVAGIAPLVRILPVRVLGPNGGSSFDVAAGILWAAGFNVSGVPANSNPAKVINLSLGSQTPNAAIEQAIADATNAGVLVVAAAGNQSQSVGYPAAFPDVVAVSAVGPQADLADYSNYGQQVELAAPGGSTGYQDNWVWSTAYSLSDESADYVPYRGTSMACPHVSAVAALCLSVSPALSPDQLRTVLQTTSVDLGPLGRDDYFGYGLVDAQAAVERALALASNPPESKPERLAARTTHLRLTSSSPGKTLHFTNTGDGTTRISAVRTFALQQGVRVSDPTWLSAAITETEATGTSDALVTVTANPGLAGAGLRHGLVEVTGENGIVTTPVIYLAETVPDLGTVTVFACDIDTGDVVGGTTTSRAKDYDFTITGLPRGTYYLVALVDKDGDDDLNRADEWFGLYPSLAMETVTIDRGGARAGLGIPLFQMAEWMQDGTGGGPIVDPLSILVRDEDTGLPLEGARVILGDGDREVLTDHRGVAIFNGLSGAQTVTAILPGYNAQSYLDIDAAEIGIGLSRTDPEEDPVDVDITVYNLLPGDTAFIHLGLTYLGEIPYGDSDQTVTVQVTRPGFLNVLVMNSYTGITDAGGWADLTAQTLASPSPWVPVWVSALSAASTLGVDVQTEDSSLDAVITYPAIIGNSLEDMVVLGMGVSPSVDTRASTRMFYAPGFEDYTASLIVMAIDLDTGAGSFRSVSRTLDEFYGSVWTAPMVGPPTLVSPARGAILREGDSLYFNYQYLPTFGLLHVARDSDDLTWTLRFPANSSQVRLPRIGFLQPGAWSWYVEATRIDDLTYETLSGLPANMMDGFAAIDWFIQSEAWEVTVP